MATPSMASTHLAQSGSRRASGSPAGLCCDLRSVAIVDAVRAALVQYRALRLAFMLRRLCESWLICAASVSWRVAAWDGLMDVVRACSRCCAAARSGPMKVGERDWRGGRAAGCME